MIGLAVIVAVYCDRLVLLCFNFILGLFNVLLDSFLLNFKPFNDHARKL